MPLPVEVADLTPEPLTARLTPTWPTERAVAATDRTTAALDDLDALGALTGRLARREREPDA